MIFLFPLAYIAQSLASFIDYVYPAPIECDIHANMQSCTLGSSMCNEAQNGHFFVCVNFMVQCKHRILASNKFDMQSKVHVVLRATITQLRWLHQLH